MTAKKELLFSITRKDFKIDFFSGRGAGGQHRNKHQNCCRIKHLDSGAIATGQSYRERSGNIREALNGIVNNAKFKMWHTAQVNSYISGKTIDEIVDEQMSEENLKVETKENGKWVLLKNINDTI